MVCHSAGATCSSPQQRQSLPERSSVHQGEEASWVPENQECCQLEWHQQWISPCRFESADHLWINKLVMVILICFWLEAFSLCLSHGLVVLDHSKMNFSPLSPRMFQSYQTPNDSLNRNYFWFGTGKEVYSVKTGKEDAFTLTIQITHWHDVNNTVTRF